MPYIACPFSKLCQITIHLIWQPPMLPPTMLRVLKAPSIGEGVITTRWPDLHTMDKDLGPIVELLTLSAPSAFIPPVINLMTRVSNENLRAGMLVHMSRKPTPKLQTMSPSRSCPGYKRQSRLALRSVNLSGRYMPTSKSASERSDCNWDFVVRSGYQELRSILFSFISSKASGVVP